MFHQNRGFTIDELRLEKDEFNDLLLKVSNSLAAPVRRWLATWQNFELQNMQFDQETLSTLRVGHYLGFLAKGNDAIQLALNTDGYLEVKRNGILAVRVTLQKIIQAGLTDPTPTQEQP